MTDRQTTRWPRYEEMCRNRRIRLRCKKRLCLEPEGLLCTHSTILLTFIVVSLNFVFDLLRYRPTLQSVSLLTAKNRCCLAPRTSQQIGRQVHGERRSTKTARWTMCSAGGRGRRLSWEAVCVMLMLLCDVMDTLTWRERVDCQWNSVDLQRSAAPTGVCRPADSAEI